MKTIWIVVIAFGMLGCVAYAVTRLVGPGEEILNLSVWDQRSAPGQSAVYLRGQPIRLDITLRYPGAERAANARSNLGRPNLPVPSLLIAPPQARWTDYVTVRFYRQSVAGLQGVLPTFDWRAKVENAFLSRADVRELSNLPASIPFILPPALTEALAPGEYRVVAAFDTRPAGSPAIWSGRVQSTAFQIQLRTPSDAAARSQVLQSQVTFAVQHEHDFARAERLALQATQLTPGDAGAWSALGSAYAANRKWREAIEALEKGMALGPPERPLDPPWRDHVRLTIEVYKQRLAAIPRPGPDSRSPEGGQKRSGRE